jgi:hypothetical protein
MNELERAQFLDAMAETARGIRIVQAALQSARANCHGEIYVEADLMSKRAHELRVKAEWLTHAVLGRIELPTPPNGMESRQDEDRRLGIDRRIARMQSQMLQMRAAA